MPEYLEENQQAQDSQNAEQVDTEQVDAQDNQDQDPPLKLLWKGLSNKKMYTNSYEEFSKKYSTPEQVDFLFNGLSKRKMYTNTKDDFYSKYFPDVKKKDGQPSKIGGQEPKTNINPLTPLQSLSNLQEGEEKPSWQTSALNPVAVAKQAQAEKEVQSKIMPQPTPTISKAKPKAPVRKSITDAFANIEAHHETLGDKAMSFGKYIYNQTLDGFAEKSSAMADLTMQLLAKVMPGTPQENDAALKQWREEASPLIRSSLKEKVGANISKEKEDEYNKGFVTSAIGGLGKMAAAMTDPKGIGFVLQAYDNGIQSVNDSKVGKDLPETAKTAYGVGNGVVMGLLMKLQLDKIFGKQSTKVASKITADIFNDLLKNTEGAITKDAFELAANKATISIKDKIVQGGGDLAKAGLTGYIFGTATDLTDVASRAILNKATGKKVFDKTSFSLPQDISKVLDKDSWGEGWGQMLHAGASMALGGVVLHGVFIPFKNTDNYIKKTVSESTNPQDIQNLKTEIVSQVNGGKVSPEDAKRVIDTIDEYASISSKTPSDIPNRIDVIDKIKQRDDLKQAAAQKAGETQGLDEVFHEPIIQEAAALNNAAENINNKIIKKPVYKIGDREVDRNTFDEFIKSEDATTQDIDLYVENDDSMSQELEKIGGVSIFGDPESEIPEHTIKTKSNDKENIPGLPSKVGVGEEPITTEPIKGASTKEVSTSGVLQAPGVKGEGEGVGDKVGEEVVPELKDIESTAKALEDKLKEGGRVDEDGFQYRNEKKVMPIVDTFTDKMSEDYQTDVSINERKTPEQFVSEAYHKAKADGSNPELVKAVEDLIGKKAKFPQQKTVEQLRADEQAVRDNLNKINAEVKPIEVKEKPLKENEYYHATDNTEILAPSDKGYKKREGANVVGEGIYFGKDKEHLTDRYGKNAIKAELDIKNPLISNNKYIVVDGREIDVQSLSKEDINFLKQKGYDAIKYEAADRAYSNFDETIIFDKSQIKVKEQVKLTEAKTVEQLRAEEQAEYDAMPDPTNEAKRKEIYDKYDKLITPLLKEGVGEDVKQINKTDFDENGDLTDDGFSKATNILSGIINDVANKYNIPKDKLLQHYNIKNGEYRSSLKGILAMGESQDYQKTIKLVKDIAFEMFPDKIDELNNQINSHSDELLNSLENGKPFEVNKSIGKVVSALFEIDENWNKSKAVAEKKAELPQQKTVEQLRAEEQEQVIKQMKPFTDKMVDIEREFKNNEYEINTDYDNEIQVLDKNGEQVESDELPDNLKKLAADYEKATSKLGEFDASAREKALAESRKVVETEAEVIEPEKIALPERKRQEPAKQIKEGESVDFKIGDINAKPITGEKITIPGHEDMDTVIVRDGMSYDIYELATGLKLTSEESFTREDAIQNASSIMKEKGVTAKKIYTKAVKGEFDKFGVEKVKPINKSVAYEQFREEERAKALAMPYLKTETERQGLLDKAKEAKDKGLDNVAETITRAANKRIEGGFDFGISDAKRMIDFADNAKKMAELKKENKPYPKSEIVSRTGDELELSHSLNIGFAKDRWSDLPADIKEKGIDAYKKVVDIYNKYGYAPKSVQNLESPTLFIAKYIKSLGTKDLEKRPERIKEELDNIDKQVKAIDEAYKKEIGGEKAEPEAPKQKEETQKQYVDKKIALIKEKGKPLSEFKVGDKVFVASDWDSRFNQHTEGIITEIGDDNVIIKRFPENPDYARFKIANFSTRTLAMLKPEGEVNYKGESVIWKNKENKAAMAAIEAVAKEPAKETPKKEEAIPEQTKSKLDKFKKKKKGEEQVDLFTQPKIAENAEESRIIESKLSKEDNPEQEPIVKTAERKAENASRTPTEELKKQIDDVTSKIEDATDVVNFPIAKIKSNETEYQGRKNKFSERSAKNVAENFDRNKFDPIVVYNHPDGNTYVLSGHSRLEGMKRRGETTIPARVYEGTPEQAKDFALKSNKLGTLQTDIENAAYYREQLKKGKSYNSILEEAKENEQQGSAKRIVSYAHLNPDGKTMGAMESLEGTEGDTNVNLSSIATKIGDIRANNEHLTNAHEDELFDFMTSDKDNIPTDKEILDANSQISRSIASVRFNPEEPLNLNRFTNKSAERIEWEKEKRDIEEQIRENRKEVNPSKTTGWTGLKDRAISSLAKDKSAEAVDAATQQFNKDFNGIKTQYEKILARKKAELKILEEKLGKHLLREKGLIEGEKNQQSLFSVEKTKEQDLLDMTDAVVDIIKEFPDKTSEQVQLEVASYTGNKTRAMSRLVAQAYKEAKNVVTKDLVKDPIVRRLNRAFLNIGTTILENSKQLMDKAKELREARFSATDNTAGYETRDGKPIGFVYDTEQVARQRFDFSKLKKIGEGSDRIVFDLGDGKVLKVAKTARGLAQNVYEGDFYLSIVPQVFERGLNYVVAENTPRIKAADVVPIYDVETGQEIGKATAGEMLNDLKKFNQKDFDTHSDKIQDVLRKYGLEDALNYELLYGDFSAGRNWGYKDGMPIHLDGGTFGGVQMIEDYKGKTNLQDEDFRDIYNESKRVKKENADKDKYTKFHYNDEGEILGFTHGKEVYLNNEKLTAKTTSEEAGHIWINDAKNNNPHLYQAGLKKVKATKYLKDVAASEFYKKEALKQGAEGSAEYNNYMEEEALSKAIADEGAKFATDTQKSDFKKWVIAMWKNVIKSFGIRNMTERQISEMSLQEFARRAAADVYSRVKESNVPEQYTKRELGEGEVRGITHAANEERRMELGMAERQPNPESFEQWDSEAQSKIQSGYDINEHIDKMDSGAVMSGTENAISKIFAATLDERLADNPSRENLSLAKRFIEARDVANSAAGRALGSIRGNAKPLSSISEFYVAKMEANGVDSLTEKQIEEVQQDFEKLQKAKDEYKRLYEEANAKNAQLLAEQELNEQRKSLSKRTSKEGKKDYATDRQNLKTKLKDLVGKYISNAKKLGISPDGGAENFALTVEMAKVIKDIAFSHFDETRGNLAEITRNTYETIKDIFSGIKEKDIHDVIAGEYAPERKQKSELMAEWKGIQGEAKILNEIDKALAGESKTEKEEIKKNQKLAELRKQLNEVKKEKGLDQYAEEEKIKKAEKIAEKNVAELEQKVADNKIEIEQAQKLRSPKLDNLRERQKELNKEIDAKRKEAGIGKYAEEVKIKRQIEANKRREKAIREKIDKGDFDTKPRPSSPLLNPEFKKKHPQLYKDLLDSAVAKEDATYDFQVKIMEEQAANMSITQKAGEHISKAFNTIKKITTGIDDSAAGIQAYMALIRRPLVGVKAFGEHAVDFWSKKRFYRNLALIKESPLYWLMEASGLSVTTPKSTSEQAHEEVFGGKHYDITVKIKGEKYKILDKLLSPFERAFTSLGNHVRVIAFSELAQKAMNEGYTFEKNPEIFKGYAEMLNTETGRGRSNEVIERNMNIVTKGIWSPRLISSRLNILGISDIISFVTAGRLGTKGYYRELPPKVRMEAIRSLAQYAATVTALTYGVAYAFGGEVDDDPDSGDYMSVKVGNKTYNFTGGFSQYIAQVAQDIRGGKTKEGKFIPFKEQGRGVRNRWENVLHFMRGKPTPATGAMINQAYGKDYAGQPVTLGSQAKNLLTPMSLRSVVKDMERDGVSSLYKSDLPNFFGINVKDERDYANISSYKSIPLEDEQKKFLEENDIAAPKIQEMELYQIDADSAHPNGVMKDEEYKSFSDDLTKYTNENIKSNMDATYKVPIKDEEGYLIRDNELTGKELAKYKDFDVSKIGDKWVVMDKNKVRYSYSDTKEEADTKLHDITVAKIQSITDKAYQDALDAAKKDATDKYGINFTEKEEVTIKKLNQ